MSAQPQDLPPELQSSRILVISDFNCPYCFTLNEWLNQLGVAERVYWVGVEHNSHRALLGAQLAGSTEK